MGYQPQFWAKHLHPETGQAAVRVNKPVYLTLHQAAAALALVYPVPPQRFGRRTAQEGVARAVVELDYHGEPLHGLRRKTVSFYQHQLQQLGVFPGNQAPAGQFWAKHLHPETGQAAVRVNKPVYLTLHQAAAALALVYPVPPQRFGRRTAQEGVARAVVELDYHGEPLHGLRRKTVSFYQHQLQQLGVFPAGE